MRFTEQWFDRAAPKYEVWQAPISRVYSELVLSNEVGDMEEQQKDSKEGLPERLGKATNELDINFGDFSFVGWLVSFASLGCGALGAWLGWSAMQNVDGPTNGPALVLGLSMIGVTVVTFLVLRKIVEMLGFSILRKKKQ